MSWLSCPNSSPMLRSCLSSAIFASRSTAELVPARPVPRDLNVARHRTAVPQSALPAGPTPIPAPLRALEEPGANQSKRQGATPHEARALPGDVLQVVA